MSRQTASALAASAAVRAAPTAPPAGPDSTVHERVRARPWPALATPPLESITSGSGRPASRGALGEPLAGSARRSGDSAASTTVVAQRSYSRNTPAVSCEVDTWTPRQRLAEQRAPTRRSCSGWREAPQQADRDRLHVAARSRDAARAAPSSSSGAQHALGAGALGHRRTRSSAGTSGGGCARAQPVELGARLAAELLEVREALGGEQRGARAPAPRAARSCRRSSRGTKRSDVAGAAPAPLERRVDGGACTPSDWSLGRRRRPWPVTSRVAGEQRGVGEGAADVHPEEHRLGDAGTRSADAGGRAARPAEGVAARPRVDHATRCGTAGRGLAEASSRAVAAKSPRGACATGSTRCPAAARAGTACPCGCSRGMTRLPSRDSRRAGARRRTRRRAPCCAR